MSKAEHKWAEVTEQNAKDIVEIKHSIKTIRDNHLAHIEKDMCKQSKKLDSLDARIWWILSILVVSVVLSMVGKNLGV